LVALLPFVIVKLPEPSTTLPPVDPPPASDATVLLKLFKLRIAPATFAKLTALTDEKALAALACNVPALTLVVPEYVLLVPSSCNIPLPILVRLPPAPVIAPERSVVLAATLNSLFAPVKLTAFESVIAALLFNSATLLDALLSKLIAAFELVRLESAVISNIAVLEADGVMKILPPLAVPNAPADAAIKLPALIVVLPV